MEHQALVSFAPWTLLVQLANLLIQAALFRKYLLRPVRQLLSERAGQLEKIRTQTQLSAQQATDARQRYEAQLLQAQQQADTLVQEAEKWAVEQAREILDAAKRSAQQLRRSTDAELRRQRELALVQTRGEVSALALALAEKIIQRQMNPAQHRALIDRAIADMEEQL